MADTSRASVCSSRTVNVSESMSVAGSTFFRNRRADRTFSTMKCLMPRNNAAFSAGRTLPMGELSLSGTGNR